MITPTETARAPETTSIEKTDTKPADAGGAERPPENKSAEDNSSGAPAPTEVEWLKTFNETFQTKYEKPDDIKSVFERSKKADEFEQKITKEYEPLKGQLIEWERKYKDLEAQLDPLKWFQNENEFKAQQLKIKYPDKNPLIIQEIVGKDLKGMDDLEVLVKEQLIDNPGLSQSMVEAVIRDHYGLDLIPPGEDADEQEKADYNKKFNLGKAKLAIDANKARKTLNEFTKIDLPQIMKPEDRQRIAEEQANKLKADWSTHIENLVKPTKLEVKDDKGEKMFEFDIPESTTKELRTYLEDLVVSLGEAPSEENINFTLVQREKELVHKHLREMLTAYGNQVKSELLRKIDEENGNTKKPNESQATDDTQKNPSGAGFDKAIGYAKGRTRQTITIG